MKDQIIETVTALFGGADEHDWAKVKNTFAENVELDYSSMTGGPASIVSSQRGGVSCRASIKRIINWSIFT